MFNQLKYYDFYLTRLTLGQWGTIFARSLAGGKNQPVIEAGTAEN
jgi:hypothetical protein